MIGHGTQVAGIVGGRGNDAQGVTGVNWQVGIMPLTTGGDVPNTAAIASAFAYAARNGAKVVVVGSGPQRNTSSSVAAGVV